MYLEQEELLKLVNTLEKERDEARAEAYNLAHHVKGFRWSQVMAHAEFEVPAHVLPHDPLTQYCDDIIRRYTPQ